MYMHQSANKPAIKLSGHITYGLCGAAHVLQSAYTWTEHCAKQIFIQGLWKLGWHLLASYIVQALQTHKRITANATCMLHMHLSCNQLATLGIVF